MDEDFLGQPNFGTGATDVKYTNNFPYYDVMNANDAPNTGSAAVPNYNIDDWTQDLFKTSKLDLHLPVVPATTNCWEKCKEKITEREKKCTEVRKRVALALKTAGCPSKLIPIKQSCKTSCPPGGCNFSAKIFDAVMSDTGAGASGDGGDGGPQIGGTTGPP